MKSLDPLAGVSVFLTLAETLNFSKAASHLDLSRATVSAQLQSLEKRLGIRLFQRSTRNVVLTEDGAAYRQALTGVLPQIREAERAAASFQKEVVGRIRISAPPDLGHKHIVPLIAEFLKANPGVSIELDLSYGSVNLVEEGYDLAIRAAIAVEPNLITRQIGQAVVFACASPDYIKRHGMPRHPEELSAHSCLHLPVLRWGRMWLLTQGETTVRVPIIPRFEVNSGLSLREAALAGAGITLLPTFLIGADLKAGRLVALLEDWEVVSIPIHAVYPANRHITMKVRQFVSFVAERLVLREDFSL